MRRFLSILLVVLLLFSLLTVPASAMSAGAVVTAVDGLAAVSSIIAGSGVTIRALEQFDAWNTLVSSASEYLTSKNIIDAVGTIAALKSGSKIYFPSSVVQTVKDWLFSSSSIQYAPSATLGVSFDLFGRSVTVLSCDAPVYYGKFVSYSESKYSLNYYLGLFSSSPFTFQYSDTSVRSPYSLNGHYYFSFDSGSLSTSDLKNFKYTSFCPITTKTYSYNEILPYIVSNCVGNVISTDFVSGSVSPVPDAAIADNYPDWVAGAITYPPITIGGTEEDEPIVYVPVSVPVYSSATPSLPLTQTEVWTGKDLTSSGTDTDDEEQVIPIAPDLSEPVNSILELIVQIAADILAIKNAVVTWFTETWAAFTSCLMETLTAIKDAVIALPGLIVAAIEAVAATVTSIWEWLKDVLGLTLQQILEALTAIKAWALGLVDALIAALAALLTEIFGVDIAAVQAAVAELRAEFPFFDSIIATGEFLYNGISSGEPPVIYAHLQNAEGSYSWGGTVAVLDMSFYARYKSTGDAIISAALYAFFGWRTFVRLPGIISGAGSDIKEVTNHYDI